MSVILCCTVACVNCTAGVALPASYY